MDASSCAEFWYGLLGFYLLYLGQVYVEISVLCEELGAVVVYLTAVPINTFGDVYHKSGHLRIVSALVSSFVVLLPAMYLLS